MTQSALLIRGARVYEHDGNTDTPRVADVLIEGSRIARVAPDLAIDRPARVIEAAGMLVLPGFFNAHYHSHDVLLKGCFEPMPLELWFMNGLPPSYPKRSPEEVRARTLLGAAECIRNGITTVQDMLTLAPFDARHLEIVVEAYEDCGLRVVFSLQVGDLTGLDRIPFWRESVPAEHHELLQTSVEESAHSDPMEPIREALLSHRNRHSRLSWALAPTSPDLCSPSLLEQVRELAVERDLPIYTHVNESRANGLAGRLYLAEHGGSQVKYLESLGLLGGRLTLAHNVWMRPDEIDLIAASGTNVVLNPASNLKTKSGIAPMRAFMAANVCIALGCDNCSCSDVQSMFQAMKLFCTHDAVSDPEPGPPRAEDALRCATLSGARTAGLASELGAIRPGMKADLVLIDLRGLSFVPLNSAARQLVYSETGADVDSVIIDGVPVMEGRRLVSVNESELRDAVTVVMEVLRKDHAEVLARNARLEPYLLDAWRRCWAEGIGVHRYVGAP